MRDICVHHRSSHGGCHSDSSPDAVGHEVVIEQRYAWGPAYRDGTLVCGRVNVIVGRVQPPQLRRGDLDEIEFVVREELPS